MQIPADPTVTVRGALDQQAGEAVWATVATVYAGFLTGDARAVDTVLDGNVTIWNHDHAPLLHGTADLDAVRAGRVDAPATGPAVATLTPREVLVDGVGEVAWCRHLLDVGYADGTTSTARVTDVLRRAGDGWLICHHHEQELPAAGLP
ncbi:nuclear transport factor 2 family protein [Modestobacter versicolor]|uniref:nuclear transport factor 2 family protein n=1 Tax=Modestobacter versicolor TaxID=429133 RepID=UPI0034DF1B85